MVSHYIGKEIVNQVACERAWACSTKTYSERVSVG